MAVDEHGLLEVAKYWRLFQIVRNLQVFFLRKRYPGEGALRVSCELSRLSKKRPLKTKSSWYALSQRISGCVCCCPHHDYARDLFSEKCPGRCCRYAFFHYHLHCHGSDHLCFVFHRVDLRCHNVCPNGFLFGFSPSLPPPGRWKTLFSGGFEEKREGFLKGTVNLRSSFKPSEMMS